MISGCSNKEFHIGWYEKCLPSTTIKIQKIYPEINIDKLSCQDVPVPGEYDMQSQVAEYIIDLNSAANECRGDLIFTRQSLLRFRGVIDNNLSKDK